MGKHKKLQEYKSLAKKYNLSYYPDVTGKRYVYPTNLSGMSLKKSEVADFLIDELWSALQKADKSQDLPGLSQYVIV